MGRRQAILGLAVLAAALALPTTPVLGAEYEMVTTARGSAQAGSTVIEAPPPDAAGVNPPAGQGMANSTSTLVATVS